MITDNEILNFINKSSINDISLVSPKLKEIVTEILINKKKMENLNILPNQVVPIELRKKVYKKTLKIIQNWETEKYKYRNHFEPSLCYFLLMVMYDSKYILHSHPVTDDHLSFPNTKKMFPELELFLKKGFIGIYTNEERINFLKSVI